MVLTEEGFHNVVFYPFETEAEARRFFYDLRASRPKILFDSLGLEIESGGWNPLALPTIRGQFGLSDTSIHDGFPPCMLRYSNVIALYSPSHGRFLRMMGDCVDGGGGRRGFDNLPDEWHSERFCVVIAKEGEIALYSVPNQRFIRMDHDADVNGKGGHNVGCPLQTDRIWVVTLLDTWGRPRDRLNACFLLNIVLGR